MIFAKRSTVNSLNYSLKTRALYLIELRSTAGSWEWVDIDCYSQKISRDTSIQPWLPGYNFCQFSIRENRRVKKALASP